MKRFTISIMTACALLLGACNKDYLDRQPLSQVDPDNYFRTDADLATYCNSFYAYLPGTAVFTRDAVSDNVECSNNQQVQGKMIIPTDASSAGWNWGPLRNINFFLAYYDRAEISQDAKDTYAAEARFFRAWFYFDMVKRFGDVPWYSQPLTEASPELYKGRDSRVLVIDSVLSDLDFATAHLPSAKSIDRVTRWTAYALKSRVALFEGTFRKYHPEFSLTDGADSLLKVAYLAADTLMTKSGYKLFSTGNPSTDYQTLFSEDDANTDEFILAQIYDNSLSTFHNANYVFTVSTSALPPFNKSFLDGFLMKDGTPFSAQPGYKTETFLEETQGRDPRLAQIIRTPGYQRIGTTKKLVPDLSVAPTGYQCVKYMTDPSQDGWNANTNDLPVFRYAEVLLNFAEAKAELGQLTQDDVDRSINLIRSRAGMPGVDVGNIPSDPEIQGLYPDVTDARILMVRRERRIELAMEGFRYDDLMRWKEGHLLAAPFYGMYYPAKGPMDLDGDGKADIALVDAKVSNPDPTLQYYVLGTDHKLSEGDHGNIMVYPNLSKTFTEDRDYLYPLPLTELLLNKNLTQNPNWK